MTAYARALKRLLASTTRPKLGLERMATLLERLGNPHLQVPVLHVAGTKGKGSTCAMAESLCRAAGLRTGLTISPHLCTARERIVLDGDMVDESVFASLASSVERAAHGLDASFFEKTVAMAFRAFADARVDIAVVEVGLGGRLDATNLCAPSACAITRLGLDHTEFLGPTLEHIAREKAGILKSGVPTVTVAQEGGAHAVVVARAREIGVPLTVVPVDRSLSSCLQGDHQFENASLAVALVRAAGLALSVDHVRRGLATVRWPGRYETLREQPLLVVDGAHNETAAEALAATVQADARMSEGPLLVLGMTRGHDPAAFARPLAVLKPRRVMAVASRSPRTLSAAEAARGAARALGVVEEASLEGALALSSRMPTIITGSLYLVGEVRARVLGVPSDPGFPLF